MGYSTALYGGAGIWWFRTVDDIVYRVEFEIEDEIADLLEMARVLYLFCILNVNMSMKTEDNLCMLLSKAFSELFSCYTLFNIIWTPLVIPLQNSNTDIKIAVIFMLEI